MSSLVKRLLSLVKKKYSVKKQQETIDTQPIADVIYTAEPSSNDILDILGTHNIIESSSNSIVDEFGIDEYDRSYIEDSYYPVGSIGSYDSVYMDVRNGNQVEFDRLAVNWREVQPTKPKKRKLKTNSRTNDKDCWSGKKDNK